MHTTSTSGELEPNIASPQFSENLYKLPDGLIKVEQEYRFRGGTGRSRRECPVEGRRRGFRHNWVFSPWAYNLVSKGLGWKWKTAPPPKKTFSQVLVDYVQELLDKKVIRKARNIKFQGRLFCIPKKDTDKKRVILDLSVPNRFINRKKSRLQPPTSFEGLDFHWNLNTHKLPLPPNKRKEIAKQTRNLINQHRPQDEPWNGYASIPKSCAKLRPSKRPEAFSWSLNKVLHQASSIDATSCHYRKCFRKTLFLLA